MIPYIWATCSVWPSGWMHYNIYLSLTANRYVCLFVCKDMLCTLLHIQVIIWFYPGLEDDYDIRGQTDCAPYATYYLEGGAMCLARRITQGHCQDDGDTRGWWWSIRVCFIRLVNFFLPDFLERSVLLIWIQFNRVNHQLVQLHQAIAIYLMLPINCVQIARCVLDAC